LGNAGGHLCGWDISNNYGTHNPINLRFMVCKAKISLSHSHEKYTKICFSRFI
jgi:hypothetical protein